MGEVPCNWIRSSERVVRFAHIPPSNPGVSVNSLRVINVPLISRFLNRGAGRSKNLM
jgi:hypothetical protein